MSKAKGFSIKDFHDQMYLLAGAAIVAGLILTIISMLGLCSQACTEGHKYRLLGLSFEAVGLPFFCILLVLHILHRRYRALQLIESLFFASAIGAEVTFIIVQKYYIGAWCPVCLGIASCIFVGSAALAASYISRLNTYVTQGNKGEFMSSILKRGLPSVLTVFVGFFIAFMGISKYDAMEAAQTSVQDQLAFGKTDSNIEAYLFTDWACPACRKLEPHVEEISKAVMKDGKIIFVDHAVHPETLNFVPYHLSFILKNKGDYFQLREMLTRISERTGSPSEQDVAKASAKYGVTYGELNYADIALAIKYYKKLGEKFKIEGTPTMVIINLDSKKGKKLAGTEEITKENVVEAIQTLKSL